MWTANLFTEGEELSQVTDFEFADLSAEPFRFNCGRAPQGGG
jgi:hypothetical protein